MKFSELLILSIQRSEIPLRFEPGAEESVAKPVTEFLVAWLRSHEPTSPLLAELLAEVTDEKPIAVD